MRSASEPQRFKLQRPLRSALPLNQVPPHRPRRRGSRAGVAARTQPKPNRTESPLGALFRAEFLAVPKAFRCISMHFKSIFKGISGRARCFFFSRGSFLRRRTAAGWLGQGQVASKEDLRLLARGAGPRSLVFQCFSRLSHAFFTCFHLFSHVFSQIPSLSTSRQSRCLRGSGCKYAHGDDERHAEPDLTKTALCRKMLSGGECKDPNCTYAHTRDE